MTYKTALDEIFGLVTETVQASGQSIVGYVPEIRYQGNPKETVPGTDKLWLRLSIQTVDEDQRTFANDQKVYESEGLVFVQIFVPKTSNGLWSKGTALAVVLRDAFRGAGGAGCVWYRRSKVAELLPEADFLRVNVTSEYHYSETY